MEESELQLARMLAEVLRLQRWAGGESVSAGRIFGLMHGFETTLRLESESHGISEEIQRKVEDILDDVEAGKQSSNWMSIKDRLHGEHISESDAILVMKLCCLESRFGNAVRMIADGEGFTHSPLGKQRLPEQDWFGALYYMELVDCTDGAHKKLHSVFAPGIPRVGELVTPENGSKMRVVEVEHLATKQGDQEGVDMVYLTPYIYLESVQDDDTGE